MWQLLHSYRVDGYHFRKQVQLGRYVVDFACLHAGLVIEVDGVTHHTEVAQSNDAVRDDYLSGRGLTVLRFAAEDVMKNEEGVCRMITAALDGKPRNHRGSSSPSRATLGPDGPSSATLPAGGRVGAGSRHTSEGDV